VQKEISLSTLLFKEKDCRIEPVILGILVEFQQRNFFNPFVKMVTTLIGVGIC
jgi:hypothetical protein